MTQQLTAYADIPPQAIQQITEVINNDEGGFKFNAEAGGDWNYAGMLSVHFVAFWQERTPERTDINAAYVKQLLSDTDMYPNTYALERNQLTIQLYYDKFYLPLHNELKNSNFVPDAFELSCYINCGHDGWLTIFKATVSDIKVSWKDSFCNAWEDHYIKMVVDNAIAWRDWAIAIQKAQGTHVEPLTGCTVNGSTYAMPHELRAINLQGWINRVRRYRSAY